MATDKTQQTGAIVAHHMQALGAGMLDAIVSDYGEDSVIFTPNGPVHGVGEIRALFEAIIKNSPSGLMDAFALVRQDVEGDVAYIVWTAAPFILLGTDTFVVRDGKIAVQTLATHTPA
jgi:ketosteroid isomerase-like protein